MTAHRPEHERILERWVTGDLEDDAPELVELLDDCEECGRRAAEFRKTTATLDLARDLQREVLDRSREVDDAPGIDRVAEVIERQHAASEEASEEGSRPVGGRPRPSSPGRWAALAALLTIAIGLFLVYGPLFRGEIQLGGSLVVDRPIGTAADFSEFVWTDAEAANNGYYIVSVYADEAHTKLLDRSPPVEDLFWKPTDTSEWGDQIYWIVVGFYGDGLPRDGRGQGSASR